MTRGETLFAHWVVRRRWWIIIAAIVVMAVCTYGVRFLTINNDTRMFFGGSSPQLDALEAMENTYDRVQNVFFALAPANGNIFTRPALRAVAALTEACWQMPYSRRVDSVTNHQYTQVHEDEIAVTPLIPDINDLSDTELAEKQRIALAEPALLNFLISPTGHVAGVNVSLILPGESDQEMSHVAAHARQLARDIEQKHPGIDVHVTGGVIMGNAYGEASKEGLSTLVPIMFAILTILVALTLRSFYGSLATLAVVLFSMLTALGLAGWLGISLNAASVGAPTLVLTLAVADSVHLLATMLEAMRQGRTRRAAIVESMRINLQAVFLTSITTAIGFLTMNFSESPPFRDLGNITAMGVTAAFVYSILLLPAMMAVLPLRIPAKVNRRGPGCQWLARLVIERRTTVFYGMLALTILLSAGVLQVELDDNFLTYFDESFSFRRATDFVLENLSGWDIVEYSLSSGEPGGICSPEYLTTVEAFANWYRRQSRVMDVQVITDVMKRLNQTMNNDDARHYRVPEKRDLAAQYLLVYELSLPFGHDLNHMIDVDKSASRVAVLFESLTTREVQEKDQAAQAWLRVNAPEHMFTCGTGLSLIWAHITSRSIGRMLWAAFTALVLISGILIIALRSVKLGLISLVPNLLPPLMAFGVWGMLVGQVGLSLSVVFSMTIGIVVDDTVHFLSRYVRVRRELNASPAEAVRYAFATVGVAMGVTTAALVAGFLVLALSHYRMISEMGLMCALTLTLALAMDLLFLPTLLLTTDGRPDKVDTDGVEKQTK